MKTTADLLSINLKALRAEKNWTQEELAEYAGLSSDVVQRIEAKSHFPRPQSLTILAKTFGIQESQLFCDRELTEQKPSESSVTIFALTKLIEEQKKQIEALQKKGQTLTPEVLFEMTLACLSPIKKNFFNLLRAWDDDETRQYFSLVSSAIRGKRLLHARFRSEEES